MAVGIIATSNNATPFNATWDFINVTNDQVTSKGNWQTLTAASGIPIGREENAYVQVGDKFYLMGGRTIKAVQMYDPIKKTWTNKSNVPIELHHFQAVVLDGLVYVIGAFTGSYPREKPVTSIYIYNPATDKWTKGADIPEDRRRGSAGAVVYKSKIYIVGGIQDGHWTGQVNWFDVYDPAANTWKTLANAPRTRDHFQAAIANDKIYVAGGRRSSGITNEVFKLTVPEVDVYDFASGKWSSLATASNIPTPRAGAASVMLGNELLVIGGESPQPAAHNETEALNINTNTWRSMADLKQGRHGSQAIENNNGIYVVTGAGNQGGSPLLTTQEVFYLDNATTPIGTALIQSQLDAPASVDFGQVKTASTNTKTITLNNTAGNQAIIISSVTKSGDNSFTYEAPFALPFVIPVGGSADFKIIFKPTTSDIANASLVVKHSGTGETATIALSGQVAEIVSDPVSLHFFSQQAGTTSKAQTITLTNTGTTSRQISSVTVTGTNKTEFAHNLTSAVTLNAGASKDVAVTFKPAGLGTKVAQLNISYSGSSTPVIIRLTGEGTNNPNQDPVANAGSDTTITLLNDSFVLNGSGTDEDGTVEAYIWKQVSGPSNVVFSSKIVAKPTISGFSAGTYVFSLVVRDDAGATSAADEITIIVDPITGTGQPGVDFQTEIYPNPVSGHFEIKVPDWKQVKSVTVMNIAGQVYFDSENVKALSGGITVTNFPAGLYLVKIKMINNRITTNRIMVVK